MGNEQKKNHSLHDATRNGHDAPRNGRVVFNYKILQTGSAG
jgi:hypothetical protein